MKARIAVGAELGDLLSRGLLDETPVLRPQVVEPNAPSWRAWRGAFHVLSFPC
jgi:hypothetical protein